MSKHKLTALAVTIGATLLWSFPQQSKAQRVGDAYMADGTTLSPTELNGQNAIGIVVDVEEEKRFTVMTLETLPAPVKWGSHTYGKVTALETYATLQQAQTDTAGWSNTTSIASFYSGHKEESIGSTALSHNLSGVSGWHIPSAGEWCAMLRNVGRATIDNQAQYSYSKYLPSETEEADVLSNIDKALATIGGQPMDPQGQGTAYWASTQKSELEAVEIYFKKGKGAQVFYHFKNETNMARLFRTISLTEEEPHTTPPTTEPETPEPETPEPETPSVPQEPQHVSITLPIIDGFRLGDILYDDNSTTSSEQYNNDRLPLGVIVDIDPIDQNLTLLSPESFDAPTYATAMLNKGVTAYELTPLTTWSYIYNDIDGRSNTNKLAKQNTATTKSPAALVAETYKQNGLDKWHIPSAGEWCRLLQKMGGACIGEENNAWGSYSSLKTIDGPEGAPSSSIIRNIDSLLTIRGVEPLLPQGVDEKRYWSSTANSIASCVNVTFTSAPEKYAGTYVTFATTSDETLSVRLMNRVPYPTNCLAIGDTIELTDPAKEDAHLTLCVTSIYPRELTLASGAISEELNIPDQIEGPDGQQYAVCHIADKAFADNDSLTAITIPYTIRSIGEQAFAGCTNVQVVFFESPCATLPQWPDGLTGQEFATAESGKTLIVTDPDDAECLREQYPAWAERIVTTIPNNSDATDRIEPQAQQATEWYTLTGQKATTRSRGLHIVGRRLVVTK